MPPLGGSACNHWSPARVHYSQVTTKIGSTLEIANFHPGQQKFIVDVWEKTCHRHALSGLEGRVVLRSSRETVSARSTRVFVQARLETKNRNWQHTCLCNHHVSTPTAAPRSSRRIVHHSGSTSAPAFWSSKQSPDPLPVWETPTLARRSCMPRSSYDAVCKYQTRDFCISTEPSPASPSTHRCQIQFQIPSHPRQPSGLKVSSLPAPIESPAQTTVHFQLPLHFGTFRNPEWHLLESLTKGTIIVELS